MPYVSNIQPADVIIDDSNADRFIVRGLDSGYRERDWSANPYGEGFAKPLDIPLIPRNEWADRIEQREKDNATMTAMMQHAGVEISNQGRLPYCWIFGVTKAVEAARVMAGLKHVPLSSASVGAKVKNFRAVGGWGSEGLEWGRQNGWVPSSLWPEASLNRSHDNAAANAERPKYKVDEFYDIVNIRGQTPRDRFDRLMTCLLIGIPVAVGYNWWRHLVMASDPLALPGGKFGIEIWNSWGTNWGNQGRGILAEVKATPDDAVGPRVTTALADGG
jgi:hypothetical protein